MSISDIKPMDVPAELRVKIEKVMAKKNFTWEDAVVYLATKVVTPSSSRKVD